MKRVYSYSLTAFLVLVLNIPVTFVITFALLPLWTWIEKRFGIESVGHSGPADWCFWTVYGLCNLICGVLFLLLRRSWRKQSQDGRLN